MPPPKDTYAWVAKTPQGMAAAEPMLVLNSTRYDNDPGVHHTNRTAVCDTNLAGAILPNGSLVGVWRHCETVNLHTVPHSLLAVDAKDPLTYTPSNEVNCAHTSSRVGSLQGLTVCCWQSLSSPTRARKTRTSTCRATWCTRCCMTSRSRAARTARSAAGPAAGTPAPPAPKPCNLGPIAAPGPARNRRATLPTGTQFGLAQPQKHTIWPRPAWKSPKLAQSGPGWPPMAIALPIIETFPFPNLWPCPGRLWPTGSPGPGPSQARAAYGQGLAQYVLAFPTFCNFWPQT